MNHAVYVLDVDLQYSVCVCVCVHVLAHVHGKRTEGNMCGGTEARTLHEVYSNPPHAMVETSHTLPAAHAASEGS